MSGKQPSSRPSDPLRPIDTNQPSFPTSPPADGQYGDNSPTTGTSPLSPVDARARYQSTPYSPVHIHSPRIQVQQASSAVIESASPRSPSIRKPVGSGASNMASLPFTGTHVRNVSAPMLDNMEPTGRARGHYTSASTTHLNSLDGQIPAVQEPVHLQYHHERVEQADRLKQAQRASHGTVGTIKSSSSDSPTASSNGDHSRNSTPGPQSARASMGRMQLGAALDPQGRGRSLTPQGFPSDSSRPSSAYGRNLSVSSGQRLSDARPASTIDLLKIPYAQQMAHQMLSQDHAKLQGNVGSNAALVDSQKTLDMYRANVKKTNDNSVQYEFALFIANAAQEQPPENSREPSPNPQGTAKPGGRRKELLKEARTILQRLSDRGYPYAQYYLADGYASGLFNSGKTDHTSAFNLFIAAGKHGHAEAGYRAALCYEFGWGCRRDVAKAAQFHRQAASKGHPGAAVRLGKACLMGDMGQQGKHREGITWLKRATENADRQYNSGPFELGLLHVNGFGADVFKDEAYAAQLFTRAAELGHPESAMRMGECYEHGLLACPRDPVLSIHFYNTAAEAGFPEAMMALCAWYLVGAEPVLQEDKIEAYQWAKGAAELELPKAEYTVGYFTEMGIGCRRDPLEANVWYVRASDHGDERAMSRLRVIREAETGTTEAAGGEKGGSRGLKKKKSMAPGAEAKDEKDCIVM